jgi:phosphatidylserine/phosphatidylglycerophosphate/cardiolipin synthase-like enzyme
LGIDIHEFLGPDTLHAKNVVVDEKYVFDGGYNFDYRSERLNSETGALIEDPKIAQDVTGMIKKDMKNAVLVASKGQLRVNRNFCANHFGKVFLLAIEKQL